jgi:hypothetical protein
MRCEECEQFGTLDNEQYGICCIRTIKECLPDRHKRRDNKFGVTWCVNCGQLFNKPCGVELKVNEISVIQI